jgi:hypothetical protein
MPPVETRVGHAGYDVQHFRGHDLFAELTGQVSWASMACLAVGGRRLSSKEERWVDAVVSVAAEADPRIWPPKVARLAAARGHALAGLSASLIMMSGSRMGAGTHERVASWLAEVVRDGDGDLGAAVRRWRQSGGGPPPGFGVPFREVDERWPPLDRALGDDVGPHVAMARRVWNEIPDPPRPNISLLASAVLLDVDIPPPAHVPMIGLVLSLPLAANAVEEAGSSDRALWRLPLDRVRDGSPALRRSPRFERRGGSGSSSGSGA